MLLLLSLLLVCRVMSVLRYGWGLCFAEFLRRRTAWEDRLTEGQCKGRSAAPLALARNRATFQRWRRHLASPNPHRSDMPQAHAPVSACSDLTAWPPAMNTLRSGRSPIAPTPPISRDTAGPRPYPGKAKAPCGAFGACHDGCQPKRESWSTAAGSVCSSHATKNRHSAPAGMQSPHHPPVCRRSAVASSIMSIRPLG